MTKLRIIKQNHKPLLETGSGCIAVRKIISKVVLYITGYNAAVYVLTDESGSIITDESLETIYL